MLITACRRCFGLAAATWCAVTALAHCVSAQDQVFPILLAGNSAQDSHHTVIVLANSGSIPARCTLELLTPDGSRWPVLANQAPATEPLSLNVPPSASSSILVTSASALGSGWGRIRCLQRSSVTSHAIIRRIRDSRVTGEAAFIVPPNTFTANLIHDPAFEAESSLAIVNPNTAPNRIVFSVADSAGRGHEIVQITLRPNEGLTIAAADLFGSSGGDRESQIIRLSSRLPFVAGGLIRYSGTFTDLEVNSTAFERYGFEDGTTQGWLPDRGPGIEAVRRCTATGVMPIAGTSSLLCDVDLDCTVPAKRNGEVSVLLGTNPPDPSFPSLVNFENAAVRVLLDFPPNIPADIGFQAFVKDQAFRSFYGGFRTVRELGSGLLEVVPGQRVPLGGFIAPGFNVTEIAVLGVKVGCSDGSVSRFGGQIRIDSIGW